MFLCLDRVGHADERHRTRWSTPDQDAGDWSFVMVQQRVARQRVSRASSFPEKRGTWGACWEMRRKFMHAIHSQPSCARRSTGGLGRALFAAPGIVARGRPPRSGFAIAFTLAFTVALLLPAWAIAQDTGRDRLIAALEATDRRIEQAETLVSASDSPVAEAELAAARNLQARAREALSANQYPFSMRLTLDARRRADRAIALVRGLPDPDRVETQLERTRELMQRARERIGDCDVDRAEGLIRNGVEMQSRAEEAVRSGRYLVALQLTMGARERAHRALRLCRIEENLQESAERALRRTDELIARAQEQVDAKGIELARDALARAIEIEARARQDFSGGLFESALRRTQSARAFAYRALRMSGSDTGR